MTETLNKLVIDCSTGEETIVPLTADEIAQREADALAYAEAEATRQAEAEVVALAKLSAQEKLAALGLNADELAALLG
jgi:hypothetical protein